MPRLGDEGFVMMKSFWDGGDVERVADESFDTSRERHGLDVGFVGDEGPSELSEVFFFFPMPNNDRFFDLPSVLFSESMVRPNLSDAVLSVVESCGMDCPRTIVAPSARLMTNKALDEGGRGDESTVLCVSSGRTRSSLMVRMR